MATLAKKTLIFDAVIESESEIDGCLTRLSLVKLEDSRYRVTHSLTSRSDGAFRVDSVECGVSDAMMIYAEWSNETGDLLQVLKLIAEARR